MSNQSDEFIIALRDMMQLITSDYKGMIIGGIAVIALGYPRVTTDIDSTIFVNLDDIEPLISRLCACGIEPRIDNVMDFARSNHILLMKHAKTGIDIDISIAMLPFEEDAIANRQFVDFAGIRIVIPRVEDIIIYKMVASRSEDMRDVEELMLRHLDEIDLQSVRKIISQFSEILDRPEIITVFDNIVRHTEGL